MRGGGAAAVLLVALLVLGPPASAGSRPIAAGPSMTVAASSRAANARPVRLTFTLRYEMQCGYPGAGALVVTFPSTVKLPQRFAPAMVKLDGKSSTSTVNGRRVTVTIPPPQGILCETMGLGSVLLTFTARAKLANPPRAGRYRFTASHGERKFAAKLAIKSPA